MNSKPPPDVGTKLKVWRHQRGLSLRGLAELCDLSHNTINLIERGITSPSVSTLHKIALALQVPITAFFEDPDKGVELILSREGERTHAGYTGVLLESLGSGLDAQTLEPFVVTVEPRAGSGNQAIVHSGHELVYCLQGELEYEVAGEACRLVPGDALLFDAQSPHRWRNSGSEPTRFLLVMQSDVTGEAVEQHLAQ